MFETAVESFRCFQTQIIKYPLPSSPQKYEAACIPQRYPNSRLRLNLVLSMDLTADAAVVSTAVTDSPDRSIQPGPHIKVTEERTPILRVQTVSF
jgi:hypothetical protein